jgi:hypothetical protein
MNSYIAGANAAVTSMIADTKSSVDPEWLVKTTIAITKPETGLLTNYPPKDDLLNDTARWLKTGDANPENASKGLTKFKLKNLNATARQYLNIKTVDDLYNPEKAARATMYLLTNNYNWFDNYRKTYPEIGLTEEDVHNLSILAYNQGLGSLRDIGMDDKRTKIVPQEIASLRALYSGKVKDVSSTKWRHIPLIGETLYDIEYPEGHDTYISRVNKAYETLDVVLPKLGDEN